jgi:hypothetical protein
MATSRLTGLLGARRRLTVGIEQLGDRPHPLPRAHAQRCAERPPLAPLVDLPLDVAPLAHRVEHLDVVVAKHPATGDVAGPAFRTIASAVRCRAFSRSISSAKAGTDISSLSVGDSKVRSRSSSRRTPARRR